MIAVMLFHGNLNCHIEVVFECVVVFASREVYHTKRMQRVIAVQWSLDNKFILSGSEEMNLRVWKANSSAKLGVVCNILCLILEAVVTCTALRYCFGCTSV